MPGLQISILSMHYPPEVTGNAPYVGALAAGLCALGKTVTAHVAHPHYPEWTIRAGYGQWRCLESIDGVTVRRCRHFIPRPPRGLRRLLSEISFGLRLAFDKLARAEVVVAVSPALFATAVAALRLRATPPRSRPGLVVWMQDIYTLGMSETKEGRGISSHVTKCVERFVLRSADRVIVIHPRFEQYIASHLGVSRERIVVIRNWTHLKPSPEISKQAGRSALGWANDVALAVHTGNMGAKQGLENVVEAARLADQRQARIRFVLVGDGGERARLETLAQGIERIEFIDPLEDNDYRFALAAADVLLVNELPGVANMAVPSKLTSYFHAGRPIVAATDPRGITASEIEVAKAGVVVPAGDSTALLEAALNLSQDTERGLECGAAGKKYCRESLAADAAISSFERVIEEVAHARLVVTSRWNTARN
ncbi:glycosyltransferase family 4 protein [Mycobacterium sp. C31M]